MRPNKEEFVNQLSPSFLDNDALVASLYDLLFEKKLSDFQQNQKDVLLMLFTSDDPENSIDILNTIRDKFPYVGWYLKEVSDYFPNQWELFLEKTKMLEDRFSLIGEIQKSLYDIFSSGPEQDIDDSIKKKLRQDFLHDLKDDSNLPDIEANFSILSYFRHEKYLKLSTTNNDMYKKFEDEENGSSYARMFFNFVKNKWFKLKKMEYKISGKTPDLIKNDSIQKPKKRVNNGPNPIDTRLDLNFNWDNYCGDEVKNKVLKLFWTSCNMYIWWSSDSMWKTHLIQAVIKKYKETDQEHRVVYTTGEKFSKEFMNKASLDRQSGSTKDNVNKFVSSFEWTDILVIDDFEALSWNKNFTQSILRDIVRGYGIQIIMLSNTPPSEIRWHKRASSNWELTFQQIQLSEEFKPLFVDIQDMKVEAKEMIIRNIREQEKSKFWLFVSVMDKEKISWLIKFLADKVSPKIYTQIVSSVILNLWLDKWGEIDIERIYKIIENISGTKITPSKDEIIDIILREKDNMLDIMMASVNDEDVKADLTKCKESKVDKRSIAVNRIAPISAEWIMLRLCVYFIKKHYYPNDSYEVIGAKFNKWNVQSIYNEGQQWHEVTKWKLWFHIKQKIESHLKIKYGESIVI